MTQDEWVPQIALVSQRYAENRHKNTIFIKPSNFHIPFSLHGDRTAILVWENSKNIQLSAIFLCAGLLAWTQPDRQRQTFCCWRVTSGLNWPVRVQNACSLQRPCPRRIRIFSGRNCRSFTLKAEWDVEITWLYEYGVFMAILLHCVVTRERFAGLTRLESPTFLRFKGATSRRFC